MTAFRVGSFAARARAGFDSEATSQETVVALLDEPSLRNSLSAADRAALQSLTRESDPVLCFEGLLAFGQRLEREDRLEAAAVVYSSLVGAGHVQPLRTRALQHLNAIQGRGALGPRIEFLLRRFAREATDPAMLVGMAGAQAVFSATRLALLSRLAASPGSNFLTRGFGARALASTAAFALEAPSFVAFTRGAHALLDRTQDWQLGTIGRDVASSYLTLAALKLSGWGSQGLLQRTYSFGTPAIVGPGRPLPALLLGQSGMLAGIIFGHSLEARLGLRPQVDGTMILADSLAMLLQFHVSGRLMHQAWPRLETLNRRIQFTADSLSRSPGFLPQEFAAAFLSPETLPSFAGIGVHGLSEHEATPSIRADHVMMAAQLPGKSGSIGMYDSRSRMGRVAETNSEATSVFRFSFPSLPKACRCLVVEYRGEGHQASRHLEALARRLREGMSQYPQLEEVRLRLSDGSVRFFHRDGTSVHEVQEEAAQARSLEAWNPYPPEHMQALQVTAPWHPTPNLPSLPEWLATLRRQAGFTQVEVAEQIQTRTGGTKDYNSVSRYERSSEEAIPFRSLEALAAIYSVDVRKLIQASNETRFPNIPVSQWATRDYPIYLENAADLRRIEYYAEQDPRRQGFGWLVYATRKNPYRYRNTVDLRDTLDLDSNAFVRLELERNAPSLRAIQGLAKGLDIPEGELIRRANHTFFSEVRVEELFPGQEIFIDPLADDLSKLRAYAANPGSLGQRLFGRRKALAGRPGVVEISRNLDRHDNYWGEREMNKISIERGNWRDWYDLFSRMNLPLDPLRPFLGPEAGAEKSASVLLHEALQGEGLKPFAERTGFDRKGLSLLLRPGNGRVVMPETILDLQRALPELEGDRFYRALRPELKNFFPESESNPPVLNITREQVAEAMAFNLGEALYAHRMEHGLELAELAQALGVSDNTLKNYESISVQIENIEVLRRAAEILELDPRLVYLHYHPQILRLFPLRPHSMDESEYRYWTRERAALRDPGNLREKLHAAANSEGITKPEALATRMGISSGLAQKYWQKIHPLTVDEIQRLTEAFPALSYRQWYEHFQGHALAHFLGRGIDGEVDYSLPEGWSLERVQSIDLKSEIREAVARHYPSPKAAAEATGIGFLSKPENLNRGLKDRTWTNDTIARVSRGLGLNRRLLYIYFRGEELRPIFADR